jgi:hypothetical protein
MWGVVFTARVVFYFSQRGVSNMFWLITFLLRALLLDKLQHFPG